MKKCGKCKKEKTKSDFYSNGMGGYRPMCKECEREKNNKYFKDKKCAYCGFIFKPKSYINKYCSHKCKQKHETEKRYNVPKVKVCNYCVKEYKPFSTIDKFCSAECRINNMKSKRSKNWTKHKCKNITGKNNPAYRNGNYCRGKSNTTVGEVIFKRNRDLIKDKMRDDYGYLFCENCNTSNSLRFEMHHLIFRSEKPLHNNLHGKENLMLLCVTCHNEFHKNKGIRNNIVKQRELNKLFGNDVLNK